MSSFLSKFPGSRRWISILKDVRKEQMPYSVYHPPSVADDASEKASLSNMSHVSNISSIHIEFNDTSMQTEQNILTKDASSQTHHEPGTTPRRIPVSVYIDVENGCREISKFLVTDILSKNAKDITIHLYTGNIAIDFFPKAFKNLPFVNYKPNKSNLKQLADVMLTMDIFEGNLVKKDQKHIILAGGDARYKALKMIMNGKGADLDLIEHRNNFDKTLDSFWKTYDTRKLLL